MDPRTPVATIALLCLANLAMLLFGLALLVDWIRNWRHVKVYWAYGLGAGLGQLLFAILGVAAGVLAILPALSRSVPPGWESGALPPGWEGSATPSPEGALMLLLAGLFVMALGLLVFVISIVQLAGVTMLGMHYAASLGHPSFPLLQRLRKARGPAVAGRALPALAGAAVAGGEGAMGMPAGAALGGPPSPAANMVQPPLQGSAAAEGAVAMPRRRPRGSYALSTLGVAAVAIVYSVLLFRLTSPHSSVVPAGLPGYTPEPDPSLTGPALLMALVLSVGAAFSEEILYRLGIQGFLARYLNGQGRRYWIPVILTALLWTIQHAGALEPGWVKLAQIFPIGLMLGWLFRRNGVESCILAHALFNVVLAPLASFLIAS